MRKYYARALASYALLQAFSGFRYSAVTQTLWFGPKLSTKPFKTFFSAASGFGTIALDGAQLSVNVIEGTLPLKEVRLSVGERERVIGANGIAEPGEPLVISIS